MIKNLTKQFIRMNPYFMFYDNRARMDSKSRAEIKRAYLFICFEEEWEAYMASLKKNRDLEYSFGLTVAKEKLVQFILKALSNYYFESYYLVGLTSLENDSFLVDDEFLNRVFRDVKERANAIIDNDDTLTYRLDLILHRKELLDDLRNKQEEKEINIGSYKELHERALIVGKTIYSLMESLGAGENDWRLNLNFERNDSEVSCDLEVSVDMLKYSLPILLKEVYAAPYISKILLAHSMLHIQTRIDNLVFDFTERFMSKLSNKEGSLDNALQLPEDNMEVLFEKEDVLSFYQEFSDILGDIFLLVYAFNVNPKQNEEEVLKVLEDSNFDFPEAIFGKEQTQILNKYRELLRSKESVSMITLLMELAVDYRNLMYLNGYEDNLWRM